MATPAESRPQVQFADFSLDLRTGELRCQGEKVTLPYQSFQILATLLEHPGEMVAREDLVQRLWASDVFVDFEGSLNKAIKRLREALQDSADQPRFIETLPRRGYRFIAAVTRPQNPAPEHEGLHGKRVSHYRVLQLVGGGGMGVVYKAEDLKLGRQVALKFLPEELGTDAETLKRFEREARAASALDHPNICSIYELDEHEGQPFIVMQLLEGQTLRDRLAIETKASRGPALPLDELLDIAIQVSRGLQAAHEKGIIHRDIKPANIFLTTAGQVKILDFGLAKLFNVAEHPGNDGLPLPDGGGTAAQPARLEAPDATGTQIGVAMGTAGYMSPEQVRGEQLDARTDIFSFGLVLYEMATGQRAFSAGTAAFVRDSIVHNSPVPVRELNSTLPAKLVTAIDKCLEKDRTQRFQSAPEVRAALEEVKRGTEKKVPRRRLAISATVVLVLVALAVGLYVRRASPARRLSEGSSSLQVHPLTGHGRVYTVAATPDGSYVAYVKKEAGKYELRLLQVATERDVQLLPGAAQKIRGLHFSPDGNFLYFLRVLDPVKDPDTLGVFRIGTLGGPVTTLATDARSADARGNSVTVSPDGKQIAYIAETASESLIVAIDRDGANRRVLARRPVALPFWFVEWSPSQETLAAVANIKSNMVLFRVDLPAGSMQDLSGPGWTIGRPAWSSDASTIFAPGIDSSSPIMQIWAFDARTGTHRALTSSSTWYSQWDLSATANDDLIATTYALDTNLSVTDQSGRPYRIPALREEGLDSAIWVDNRVVTSSINQMQVHDPDGRNPTKLRVEPFISRQLARCGPGKVVYWAVDAKRQSYIARTDITTGSSSALTDGPVDVQPTCTADGSTLVFVHCSDLEPCALVRKSLSSGQSPDLHRFGNQSTTAASPSVSPDGKSVLFWRYIEGGDPYEWAAIIPLAGGEVKKIRMPIPASQAGAFRWAADGKSILYCRTESGVENIWSMPLAGGAPRRITNFDSDQRIFAFDVSPEGRLVISRGNWISDVVLLKKVSEAVGQPSAAAN